MKYFIISDSHFLHKNIIQYCNRPTDFNKLIIKNWNKVVKPEDIVIHLGDVACGFSGNEEKLKQIFNLLTGTKYLIRGNHDTKDDQFYIDLGFKDVKDYLIIETGSKKVFLCHYPLEISIFESQHSIAKQSELINIFKENNCSYLIHGHTHNAEPRYKFAFNASVERINYTPIEFSKCLEGLTSFQNNFQ